MKISSLIRKLKETQKSFGKDLVTGWFIWHKNWTAPYWTTRIMDVQDGVVKRG